MRIDEITVQNYKCFEKATLRFDPHFNVIIGRNASGKTSLLDALSYVVRQYLAGINDDFVCYMSDSEVRTALINGQPTPQPPTLITAEGMLHGKNVSFRPILQQNRSGSVTYRFSSHDVSALAQKDRISSRGLNRETVFPLIAYYGTGRLWKNADQTPYFKQIEGVMSGYENCLSGAASNAVFLSWFKTYEDTVKKFRLPEHELLFSVFKQTVSSMVPSWTDMDYNYLLDDLMGTFKGEDGKINMLPFRNLSDGYRNTIGMVADMVYRCLQLNPHLKENAVTGTDGVILIDEIDLHLHPEWQRNIVSDLKRIFPKVQFFATTHSPFIVQSLESSELINLDRVTDVAPNQLSIEDVAEDIMGVSSPMSAESQAHEAISLEYLSTLAYAVDTEGVEIAGNC